MPNFLETIKNKLSSKPSYDNGKAYVVSLSSNHFSFLNGSVDNTPKNIKPFIQYKNAYLNVPIVSAAIDKLTDKVVQEFYFTGSNSDKIEKFSDKHNLGVFFHRIVKQLLIYGNAFVEVVKKAGTITELKIIDPISMDVSRSNTGKILGFYQTLPDTSVQYWGDIGDSLTGNFKSKRKVGKIDDIIHFKFNVLNSEKMGTGLIHRVLPCIDTKLDIEQYLKPLVKRYVAPLIHFRVGDNDIPFTDTLKNQMKSLLEDLHTDSELVTSSQIDSKVLGFDKKGIEIEPLLKHLDNQIRIGLLLSPVATAGGDKNSQAAEVQLRYDNRTVKSIQRWVKTEFEDKLITPYLGTRKDKLEWGSVEERESQINVEMLRSLVDSGIITSQKANSLLPDKFHETLPDEKSSVGMFPQNKQPIDNSNVNDPTKSTKIVPGNKVKRTDFKAPMDDKGAEARKGEA